jgi:hypothetical protein
MLNNMGLEEIEGIRQDINKLNEEREINIKEVKEAINDIKVRYKSILEREGKEYCEKNCSDIPIKINNLLQEIKGFY